MKSMTSVITKSALVLAACASMNAFAGTPSGKAPAPAPEPESGALFDTLGATLEVGYDTRYYFRGLWFADNTTWAGLSLSVPLTEQLSLGLGALYTSTVDTLVNIAGNDEVLDYSELDLSDEAIDLDRVMADVSGAKRRVVILDACRNNPFGRSWSRTAHRNVTRGLGDVQVDDILVIFAAASGQLASDGPGQPNSPFAVALSKRLVQPELPLQLLGNVVRDDVLAATGREAQRPFISASMGGDLYYLMPRAPAGEKDAELERLRRQVEALQKAQTAPPVQPITTTTPTGRAPGTPFTECTGCPAMIVIPGGSFTMGSPNGVGEANEHPDVRLSVTTFAMSRTEITVAQWAACVADGVCGTPGGRLAAERRTPPANTPILGVTYNDAKNYVRWINNRLGINRYRLPSEAEWEYAARANSTGAYPWDGAAVGDHANAAGRLGARDKFDSVAPVGAFPANAFGLVDMHGNAAEWVEDCYWPNPTRTSSAALVVAAGGYCPANVVRGGAFNSAPPALRSAARGSKAHTSVESTPTIGFRIARTER